MKVINSTRPVREYYDNCQKWFSIFYSDSESLGIHYGFWDDDSTSRKQALINQYVEISNLLGIKKNDKVLDAGCGVGGASLWLAGKIPAEFTGITLSQKQLKLARKNAEKRNLSERVNFYSDNYFKTKFRNGTFDKVFAIESFCYSYPHPEKVLSEMHRIMKKGAKIAVSDGILLRQPKSANEKNLANNFLKGFRMEGWCSAGEIAKALEKTGFRNLIFIDKTKSIRKSVNDIHLRSKLISPLKALKYLGLLSKYETDNFLATNSQKELYNAGLFGYGMFCAEK